MTDQIADSRKVLLRSMYGYYYEQSGLFVKSIQPALVTLHNSHVARTAMIYVTDRGTHNVTVLCDPVLDIEELREPIIYSDDLFHFQWFISAFNTHEYNVEDTTWGYGQFVTFTRIKKAGLTTLKTFKITELKIYGTESERPAGTSRIVH
jgi:hypothetical protein